MMCANKELTEIYYGLVEMAEKESTKLYRLAWRMQAHGCKFSSINECRQEARELHMISRPEMLLNPFKTWKYAFKF